MEAYEDQSTKKNDENENSFGDMIGRIVLQKYNKLTPKGKPQNREYTILAAIVMSKPKSQSPSNLV